MIIKVNENGINIDVSMSQELTERFNTTNATIPRWYISKFKIRLPENGEPEMVELIDVAEESYVMHYSLITKINEEVVFLSNLDVFNKINSELFKLT